MIKGGHVIDGDALESYLADVLVRDDRIAEVGCDISTVGRQVLEAAGAYVTPGFIDSHTHYDPSMFWGSLGEMSEHGVTTVLIGNCSLGLAPVRAGDRAAVADLFGFIEDVPAELCRNAVPWNWESFGEYADELGRRAYAANVCALVSHSMIRQYVIGEDAWIRASTAAEIASIAAQLDECLAAGAIGMSTSFFDRDSRGRVVPSFHADDEEFASLISVLGRHDALLQLIPRHPDPTDVCEDLKRMGRLAKPHGVRVLSNAIGESPSQPEAAEKMLACTRKLQAEGAKVFHMLSPRSIELAVNPHQTMVFFALPVWNEFIQAVGEPKRAMLQSPDWRARARQEWDETDSFMFPNRHLERIRVLSVGKDSLADWENRTLADIVAARGGHPSDVLADWLSDNDLDAQFIVPMSNLDPQIVGDLAIQPEVLISGSDAGAHFQMFCGVGDSTLLLTRHVRELGHMDVVAAVTKLTAAQADFLGLKDRGRIRPGAKADITVFALDELAWLPEFKRNDLPGGGMRFLRPPGNYRYTLIDGVVVQHQGALSGALPGRFVGA